MAQRPDEEAIQRIAAVKLGLDVEEFLRTDIGRYLMARAKEEERAAIAAFKVVDPGNRYEVRGIQQSLDIPERLKRWLEDAVQGGNNAAEQQKQIDDEGDGT